MNHDTLAFACGHLGHALLSYAPASHLVKCFCRLQKLQIQSEVVELVGHVDSGATLLEQ
jgi:hypothetical protein